MDINKAHLEKFKEKFSPFAHKVLMQLLTFKQEDGCENIGETPINTLQPSSNGKIMGFNDIRQNNLSTCQISYKKSNLDERPDNEETVENPRHVSTTEELLTAVCGAIHVIHDTSGAGTTANTIRSRDVVETHEPLHETLNHDKLEKQPSVNWNDIFDEDFFANISTDVLDEHNKDSKSNDIALNIEDSYKALEAKVVISEDACEPDVTSKTKKDTCEPIVATKKISKNKNNKTQKIKIKKLEKQSYRKEVYSKTVKNWLNDVVCDETDNISTDKPDDRQENKNTTNKTTKVKKIVQTQLANRGGIMKFTKPQVTDSTEGDHVHKKPTDSTHDAKVVETNEILIKHKGKQTYSNVKLKEKRTRSKFVAPVLTPLPVRDVTYEVVELDPHSPHRLLTAENDQIVIVLLYGNGFNQLNCLYASTDCVPGGVMLGVQEQYYYIKDLALFPDESICHIIRSNTLVCFNAKELLVLLMHHYDLSSCSYNIIDLKVGSSLLHPDELPDSFSKLQKLLGSRSQFSISSACPLQKCARYVGLLRECDALLRARLQDAGMWRLFTEIEMQALPIIAEMEHRGICVDVDHLRQLETTLVRHMKEAEAKCYEAAGRPFQINSALQVRTVVYDELKLDERCNVTVRETLGKAKSTSEAMLRLLRSVHPLPALVLQYRHLHKARATFVAGILHHARAGVIRPTWEQNAAVTGRVACNNPNLQAIPRSFHLTLDTEEDNDGEARSARGDSLSFRAAFVARAGHVLLAADFRHAECRVFALAAADDTLSAALASHDLFAVLAAEWLDKCEAEVSAAERERTKRLVYACLYGAGARTLADILRMSEQRAHHVLDSFHKSFPALRRFGADVVRAARGGRLRTAGGRARSLPHLNSDVHAQRAHAERQAINFIVQGSAADLCKSAMVRCGAALRAARLAARPLLQIHDELLWEVAPADLPATAQVIQSAMEGCGGAVGLAARFPVRLSAGASWGELAPYPPSHLEDS